MNNKSGTTWAISIMALTYGCGAPTASEEREQVIGDPDVLEVAEPEEVESQQPDEATRLELEGKFNTYAQALVDRDVELMDALVSMEVKKRVAERGADLGGFIDKMSRSMLTQFDDMSMGMTMGSPFTVTDARIEGDSVRVEVAYKGETMPKPFYFVSEDGDYKMNLRAKGFTNPVPEGAGASTENYVIKNLNYHQIWVSCQNNYGRYVNANAQANQTCTNTCGWWDGTGFWAPTGGVGLGAWIKCDWNAWGIDVYYNDSHSAGAYCNDGC